MIKPLNDFRGPKDRPISFSVIALILQIFLIVGLVFGAAPRLPETEIVVFLIVLVGLDWLLLIKARREYATATGHYFEYLDEIDDEILLKAAYSPELSKKTRAAVLSYIKKAPSRGCRRR